MARFLQSRNLNLNAIIRAPRRLLSEPDEAFSDLRPFHLPEQRSGGCFLFHACKTLTERLQEKRCYWDVMSDILVPRSLLAVSVLAGDVLPR